jgi:hypothetical protein
MSFPFALENLQHITCSQVGEKIMVNVSLSFMHTLGMV